MVLTQQLFYILTLLMVGHILGSKELDSVCKSLKLTYSIETPTLLSYYSLLLALAQSVSHLFVHQLC